MATTGYIDLPVTGGGSGVSSLNSLTGALTLAAGSGITITPSGGNTLTIASTSSGGSVTSVSVVTANGLAGTVANPTTTPALTLSTTVTGVLKGNGTAISAAIAGTDYQAPITLATTGTSGAATFIANTLNIPQYQGVGNYITALTGDGTATGPGSAALTLATVNSNVGSFGSASSSLNITVNGKGLITAASTNAIQITESQVTNLVSDLAGKQATLTIGDLTDTGTDGIVITGGTGAIIGTGASIAQHVADATHNGYLSSSDWSTFSAKQPSGTYVTAVSVASANGLAGTSSGGATPALTLSTSVTGIIKGNGTSLSAAIAGTDYQSAGSYITALTGDVTASGPGSAASTISVGAVTDAKGSLANKPSVAVAAVTNQTLSGLPTIDGQATAVNTLILLTGQTSGSENGPWQAQTGAWTRPSWYPSGGTTQAGQFITTFVRLGAVYGGSIWRQTSAGPVTIDTTSTTWLVTPEKGNYNSNYTLGTSSGSSPVNLIFSNTFNGTLAWNPASNQTTTLPASPGAAGSYLSTDGSGNLSYTNPLVNIDGGTASSVYTSGQLINGGTP